MKKRLPFIVAPAVLLLVLLAAYLYNFTVSSAQELYLTPIMSDAKGWSLYAIEDGETAPVPTEDILDYPQTLYMERTIPEEWGAAGHTRVRLSPARWYMVFVDGSPVYTNCPGVRFETPVVFPQGGPVNYDANPGFDLSALPVGATLTVASAPISPDGAGAPMFVLTSDTVVESVYGATISGNVIPITIHALLGLLLVLLFAYGLVQGQANFGLLLLALAAFIQMAYFHGQTDTHAGLLWILPLLRQAFWLFPMLYCGLNMRKHRKLFCAILFSCWSLSIAPELLLAFAVPIPVWMSYGANLLYLPICALLVLGFMERKESPLFRLLMPGMYGLLGSLAVLYFLSLRVCAAFPDSNTLFHQINYFVGLAAIGSPHDLITLFCTLQLFLLLLVLAVEQISESVKQAEDAKLLALKNDLALESIRSMERSAEALAVARHDELSHLKVIAGLCRSEPEQAADYAASLVKELSGIPALRYTENALLNTILIVQGEKAAKASVGFQAEAILPQRLSIPDKDLCAVLMNLTDNAIQSAEKSTAEKRVNVRLSIEDDYLLILIENSLPDGFEQAAFRETLEQAARPGQDDHGFGIRSVKAILKRYGGELRYTIKDNSLAVHTVMLLQENA